VRKIEGEDEGSEFNWKSLAAILLVVIVFVIIIMFLIRSGVLIKSKSDRSACMNSVLAQSVLMELPFGQNLIPPQCKTYNVKFSEDHVDINDKAVSVYDLRSKDFVTKFNGLTNDIVNGVLAEELRGCWQQYLEGRKYIIDRKSWISILQTGQPRFCVLCDEVSFASNVKTEKFTGFYDFTNEKTMRNANMTYYAYYAKGQTICTDYSPAPVNCWESYFADQITKKNPNLTPENILFYKNTTYAVVFIMRGLKTKIDILSESDVDFFSYVLPTSELSNQCDSIQRGPSQ